MVAGIDFHIGDTDIRLLSTYWPGSRGGTARPSASGSLWSKLESFLHSSKNHADPLQYIQERLTVLNEEHLLLPHSTTLIGGDFNALRAPQLRGRGVHPTILSWARQTGLLHVFSSLGLPQIPTYYSGSTPKYEIDHILMSADSHLLPSRGIVLALHSSTPQPATSHPLRYIHSGPYNLLPLPAR